MAWWLALAIAASIEPLPSDVRGAVLQAAVALVARPRFPSLAVAAVVDMLDYIMSRTKPVGVHAPTCHVGGKRGRARP